MNFYKPVESQISSKKETSTLQTVANENLSFTKCIRTSLTSKEANYFSSFNLPPTSADLLSGTTITRNSPELFQLNVDNIAISPIPQSYYNEMIDGRSITLKITQQLPGTADAFYNRTIVSSTYSVLSKKQYSVTLGSNIAYLFADSVNPPYTGTTAGGTISHSGRTTWYADVPGSGLNYTRRPYAVPYEHLEHSGPADDRGSDSRGWSNVNQAAYVPEAYPEAYGSGYNYDIPVGFAALDKGYIVLTHPDIVNNIPWVTGSTMHFNGSGVAVAGAENTTSATTNVYFGNDASTGSTLSFYDLNVAFKTSVVCLSMPREFFVSMNTTWNLVNNIEEMEAETFNFDSIYVTQVGLYNRNLDLIAVAKMDRPTEKTYTNIITFNLELDV